MISSSGGRQFPASERALLWAAATALVMGCALFGLDRTEWVAGDLRLEVDSRGRIVLMEDANTGRDFLAKATESPLLSMQLDGVLHPPLSFDWDAAAGLATLGYEGGASARVRATPKETHLVLEVLSVNPADRVDLVVWGPFATTISDTVGETVGVVRDSSFAIGIQALNRKTLGGLPWRDNDFPPQIDMFESGDFSDLSEEGKRTSSTESRPRSRRTSGARFRPTARNRAADRVIANWGHGLVHRTGL